MGNTDKAKTDKTEAGEDSAFVLTPNGKFRIHRMHLAASGLTLEAAESLLRRDKEFLLAYERGLRTLLVQTPESRKEWARKNNAQWEAVVAGLPCPSWEFV
jgi:hypothetical protein